MKDSNPTKKASDPTKTLTSKPSNRTQKPLESTSKAHPSIDKTIPAQPRQILNPHPSSDKPNVNKQTNKTLKNQIIDKTLIISQQTQKIDKTLPSNKINKNDSTINQTQSTDKTAPSKKNNLNSKNFQEETKAALIFDDKTEVFKSKGTKIRSDNQVNTQFNNFFNQPLINVFQPNDSNYHTVKQLSLSKKSVGDSKFGVKIALETNRSSEKTGKTFNISEIIEFSEGADWVIEDVLLGKGSYGNVYKVMDRKNKQFYALKTIELNSNDEEFDFLYEKTLYEVFLMRQTNKLNSPNILKLVDCFRKNNEEASDEYNTSCNIMIVMELCECSLNDMIEHRKENGFFWSDHEILYYFTALLETLMEISNLNISHRDIKPRNILYNLNTKTIKFADFGEGKLITPDLSSSLNKSLHLSPDNFLSQKDEELMNTVRGTPLYMSPEIYEPFRFRKFQCTYHPLSSDLYSLGLTFLVMKRHDTDLTRNEIPEILKESVFQADSLPNRLIRALLYEDPKKRLDSVREIYEKELKPMKGQFKVPEEGQILKIVKMKCDENLTPSEIKLKQLLMAKMYQKLGKSSLAQEILNALLDRVEFEIKNNAKSDPVETLFFKYRTLVSLASIEIEDSKNELALEKPLKKLQEAEKILIQQVRSQIEQETFRHEYGNLLNEFGRCFKRSRNNEIALDFYEKALKLAKDLDSKINMGVISYNLGNLYIQMKEYKIALDYLTMSLKILESLQNQQQRNPEQKTQNNEISHQVLMREMAKSQKLIGEVFHNQKLFDKAEIHAKKSLEIMQNLCGERNLGITEFINFNGIVNLSTKKFDLALSYFNKSLDIIQNFLGNDSVKTVPTLINLGVAHLALGHDVEAEKIHLKLEEICLSNNLKSDLAHTYYSQGNLYSKSNDIEKSRASYQKSIEIYESLKIEPEKVGFMYCNLGVMSASRQEFELAKRLFQKSLDKYQACLGKQDFANNPNVKRINEFLKKLK